MKAIGIKMVELAAMTAAKAIEKGYRVGDKSGDAPGYEVTYKDGYKSWCPKEVADEAYFILDEKNDGTKILKEDVDKFITNTDVMTIGDKTTLVNAHTIIGFDVIEFSSCVDKSRYNKEIGAKYAMEKVVNNIWAYLGFVLQWAKCSLNRK